METPSTHNVTRWLQEIHDPQTAQEAWARLVERLYPVSFVRARRRGLSEADAASVEQRALLKLFSRLQAGQVSVTHRGQLFGLLSKIAHDEVVDRVKAKQRLALRENLFADGDDSAVDDTLPRWLGGVEPSLEEQEEANLLERRFLAALSDEQLAVYQLRVEEDLSVDEIKDRLGGSRESVYRRLQEMDDIIRALGSDTELAWAREAHRVNESREILQAAEGNAEAPAREVLRLWLAGQEAPQIARERATTPARVYAMLRHVDDVVYVLRRQDKLNDLRERIQAAGNEQLVDDLRAIIKKRKWAVFEAWIAGQVITELLSNPEFTASVVFATLRAVHESSRAIRRVL